MMSSFDLDTTARPLVDEHIRPQTVFHGTKLVLLIGEALVTLHRDDDPDIAYPGHWDLPGGGREGAETPVDCALRELFEETNLVLDPADLGHAHAFGSAPFGVWFAARLPAQAAAHMRLGDEGQALVLMPPEAFLSHPRVVPHFPARTRFMLQFLA